MAGHLHDIALGRYIVQSLNRFSVRRFDGKGASLVSVGLGLSLVFG